MDETRGWSSAGAARRYVSVQSEMVPGRAEVLALVAGLAAARAGGRPRVLDLGCGHGEVAVEILALAPATAITMVDLSDEMLRRAGARLPGDPRVTIVKHDLNQGLPAGLGPDGFDAVVSCFAIHHVDVDRRRPLYREIRAALRPDGIFVNGDRFASESPAMAAAEMDRWVAWMAVRARERFGLTRPLEDIRRRQLELDAALGDQPRSIWAMRDDLRAAGFAHVDCLYKNQVSGVLAALG